MTTRMRSAVYGTIVLACSTFAALFVDATYGGSAKADPRDCLTSAARSLLARIEAQFGRMQIISTCRPGARIAGTGRPSRHASGNAVDFNAGARKGAVIQWLIANHRSGGTMTYPRMDHIHVDVGSHFVSLAGSRVRTSSNDSPPPVRERAAWREASTVVLAGLQEH